MEAGDTVMKGGITSLTDNQQKIVDKLLEKQAEIAWKARDPEIAEAHKAGKEECAKTHFKPDWKIKAKDLKEGMEESYKAGQEEERKRIGEWLNKNYTRFGSSVSQLDCFTDPNWVEFVGKLMAGKSPERVKP